MELPWFGVDCSTVKAPRGERSAPRTSACATSEKPPPGSGRPAPRGTGLCFTFVSVSAAMLRAETPAQGRVEGSRAPRLRPGVGQAQGAPALLLGHGAPGPERPSGLFDFSTQAECPHPQPWASAEHPHLVRSTQGGCMTN